MSQRRSIPTWYAGNLFRARLEARWAAFFDELGWEWVYEPFNLAGYIPDFAITNFKHGELLVEVKPRITRAAMAKIEASGWDKDALVVGAYPVISPAGYACGAYIGELSQRATSYESPDWNWAEGLIACQHGSHVKKPENQCGAGYGLIHTLGTFRCYRCGEYEGGGWKEAPDLQRKWRAASSAVQWNPEREATSPSVSCATCGGGVTAANIGGFSGRPERKVWCEPCAIRTQEPPR